MKILKYTIPALIIGLFLAFSVQAQVSGTNFWKLISNRLSPISNTWSLLFPVQTADPTGTNGLTYYNSSTGKFRCYENGAWKNCDTTGSGGGATTTINSFSGPDFTFATGTMTGFNLNITGSGSTITFSPSLQSGYVIPLTASTTEWSTFYSTGTTGKVARWISNTNLSTGLFLDNGTVSGVNATSSTITFNVQGSAGLTPFVIASSTGTALVTITQAGNVGIGTTGPNGNLHINGSNPYIRITDTNNTAPAGAFNLYNAGDALSIYRGTFGVDATSLVTIKGNGNVGIGTTGPVAKLDVAGNAIFGVAGTAETVTVGQGTTGTDATVLRVRSGNTPYTSAGVYLNQNGTDYSKWVFNTNNTYFDVTGGLYLREGLEGTLIASFNTTGTTLSGTGNNLVVQGTGNSSIAGNVGIGTTSPSALLNVYGSGTTRIQLESSNGQALVDVRGASGQNSGFELFEGGAIKSSVYWDAAATALKLYNGGDRVTILNTGNVGIGTTTPSSKLQVVGDLRLGHAAGTAGQIIFQNNANSFTTTLKSSSSQASSLTFTLPPTSGSAGQLLASDGAGITYWATDAGLTTIGSGNTGFGAIWNGANTLAQGKLIDNGTVIGMNATSSTVGFLIQGTAGTNDIFKAASSTGTSILRVEHDGDVIVRDNRYGEYKVKPMTSSVLIASTSLDTLGKQLSNATTTFIRRYPFPVTLVEIGGETISAGTALCRAGDGTNFTGGLAISTTYSTTTPASNNTWTADEKIQFEIGSAASTPQGASCNFTFMPTP